MNAPLDSASRTAWISQGFERLAERVLNNPGSIHFDILVIGSGYGGAVAAATFAGRKRPDGTSISVGVLERGKEYLPGAFPTGLGELPRHVRRDKEKEGLFDVRLGKGVATVVANGVGGGSLINAGVMEPPLPRVFQSGWPTALSGFATLKPFYEQAAELLGAGTPALRNTIKDHPDGLPEKYKSIRDIADPARFKAAAITVAMSDGASSGNVRLNKCVRCGDCATGCNFGAKNSLDVNLLARAQQQGAEIFSGATVLDITRDGGEFLVRCVHTNASLRERSDTDAIPGAGKGFPLRARKVVLAAGTLGSTEILMRSQSGALTFSGRLGKGCSTNGDMLIADYATDRQVNTVADEVVKPSQRAIGPTITGMIDLREKHGILIEEMSVPASLARAFTEVFATVNSLHALDTFDFSSHSKGFPDDDCHVTSKRHARHSALYAVMGNDKANGEIEIGAALTDFNDGVAKMAWSGLPDKKLFEKQVKELARRAAGSGGRLIPNPLWRLLPPELEWLLGDKRGPLTTVHPLGGCIMADDAAHGVVDDLGRVFSGTAGTAVHEGLVVLDGSVIPTALATNPALTIAAVALRACKALAAEWGLPAQEAAPAQVLTRPVFRRTDFAAPPAQTQVEIIERLSGPARIKPKNKTAMDCVVELTLRFEPKSAEDMSPGNGGNPVLNVASNFPAEANPAASTIRIFPRDEFNTLEREWHPHDVREDLLEAMTLFKAPLTGRLKVFERQPSNIVSRTVKSLYAWTLNRGLRDIYQAVKYGDAGPGVLSRIRSGLALASRAGEIRTLGYDLRIGIAEPGAAFELSGNHIIGTKTFTYARRGNPWRQLMEVTLERFPGLSSGQDAVLNVDAGFLARIGVPLMRLAHQRDAVASIAEIGSFLGYFVRLLIGIHVWSFRSPDKDLDPANDVVDFNPPAKLNVNGTLVPAQHLSVPQAGVPDREPERGLVQAKVNITRYPHPNTTKRPVVMFHGYSAGGTTFAHHAVNPNFASHLWASGRDVWIADLRTSPAVRNIAKLGWSFDEIAMHDVPLVIRMAAQQSVDGKVDVVAHCMGTVVFSMAALAGQLATHVNRAAFTQVGPLVAFTPANVLRAYVLRYLVEYLPDNYQFKPDSPTLADDLLDRVLSTMPYPDAEFDIENPPWPPSARTPWTRTRHRMDALYGRDFNLANMEPETLRFIDEHFGALSLRTVSTTLHFVRYAMMTDRHGWNNVVSRDNFRTNWKFPAFSVHGGENGLSHPSTVHRMKTILRDSGRVYLDPVVIPEAGHQDALVGTKRHRTFREVTDFLDKNIVEQPVTGGTAKVAYPPWIGPIITKETDDNDPREKLIIRLGSLPSHRAAEGVLMLRVLVSGDQVLRPDNMPWDEQYIADHMEFIVPPRLKTERWTEFEAPRPEDMRGYDKLYPGNALLVLLVYDESPDLAYGSYSRNLETRQLEVLDQFEVRDDFVVHNSRISLKPKLADKLDPAIYDAAAKAGMEAFQLYRSGRENPAAMRMRSANLQVAGAADRSAQATLESLLNKHGELMDGIVPYALPDSPVTPAQAVETSFALASCQYPSGIVDAQIAFAGYGKVAGRLRNGGAIVPRFMLFAGDQVYVDPTAGLYDPANLDDRYRLPYENWLRDKSVRTVLRQIPSFMLLDDHEIADNWEPVSNPDATENRRTREKGVAAFQKYQRGVKKDLHRFDFDGFPFFMLDTRSGRTHRSVGTLGSAKLFDHAMLGELKTFLSLDGPKFVITPVMLLPRHARAVQRDTRLESGNLAALHSDGWDGYTETMREVLGYIAEKPIRNVVFLSGDEHRACVASAQLTDAAGGVRTRFHSVHTAAMYSPFPFANSLDEDFVDHETITFTNGANAYNCVVDTVRPAKGDGATYFRVRKSGQQWLLDCEFADGSTQVLVL